MTQKPDMLYIVQGGLPTRVFTDPAACKAYLEGGKNDHSTRNVAAPAITVAAWRKVLIKGEWWWELVDAPTGDATSRILLGAG